MWIRYQNMKKIQKKLMVLNVQYISQIITPMKYKKFLFTVKYCYWNKKQMQMLLTVWNLAFWDTSKMAIKVNLISIKLFFPRLQKSVLLNMVAIITIWVNYCNRQHWRYLWFSKKRLVKAAVRFSHAGFKMSATLSIMKWQILVWKYVFIVVCLMM